MKEVVIVDALRTPFDKFGGAMRDIPSIDLGAYVIKEIVGRNKLKGNEIDEMFYGTCMPGETALHLNVPARQAMLKAGLSDETVSLTIDRACCSSITAVQLAYRAIKAGEDEIVLAVGAENMSRVPYLVDGARWGKRLGSMELNDQLAGLMYPGWTAVSMDAGTVAVEENVSREMQDEWALRSQQRYQQANADGKFNDERIAFTVKGKKEDTVITEDVPPRADTTLEKLAKLPTIYGNPTCTAGNSPGMNTGASAILMMSAEKAAALGLKPLAKVLDASSTCGPANQIPRVPAAAIKKSLARTGKTIDDMKLIEINEAFAAVTLVSTKLLADGDEAKWAEIREKTNVNGGAIAMGHPVGASGARILMTLAYELRRRGGGCGVAAICGGLSQGDAVMIEV